MGHVVRDTGWALIDVDTSTGHVFLQQRWKYNWKVAGGQSAWSYAQKKSFHTSVDKQIWAVWSNRVTLEVTGTASFCRRFRNKNLPINLDVRWVTAREHWNVDVTKVAAATSGVGEVFWNTKRIKLNTTDLKMYRGCNSAATPVCNAKIRSVPHEFGHAAGNTWVLGRGDEYKASSTHLADSRSILNIGNQLRNRHFRTILEEMNKMISDCTFSVKGIKNPA